MESGRVMSFRRLVRQYWRSGPYISPDEVARFDFVRIDEAEVPNADMRKLLGDAEEAAGAEDKQISR